MSQITTTSLKRLKGSNSGVAILEFAIIAPVLFMILMGVIELGVYFLKWQMASRAASMMAASIQATPTDTTIRTLALNSGMAMANFSQSPNYVCAMSYKTQNAASAALCSGSQWQTTAPAGVAAGTPYYVAVVAYVKQVPIIPGFTVMPDVKSSAVFLVGTPSPTLKVVVVNSGWSAGNIAGMTNIARCPAGYVLTGSSCDMWRNCPPGDGKESNARTCNPDATTNSVSCNEGNAGCCQAHAICVLQ